MTVTTCTYRSSMYEWWTGSPQETNNILCTCTYTEGEKHPWRTTWQPAPFKLYVQACTAYSRQRSVSSYITSELGRQHVHGKIHWCKYKTLSYFRLQFCFFLQRMWKKCWGESFFEDLLLISESVHIWVFCFEAIFLAKTLILLNLSKTPFSVLPCFRWNQFLILIPSSFLLVGTTLSQNTTRPTTTAWPKRSQTSAQRT